MIEETARNHVLNIFMKERYKFFIRIVFLLFDFCNPLLNNEQFGEKYSDFRDALIITYI